MPKEIEIRLDDLYASVSFGGGGGGKNSRDSRVSFQNPKDVLNRNKAGVAVGSVIGGALGGRLRQRKFGAFVGSVAGAYIQEGFRYEPSNSRALDRHPGDVDGRGGLGVASRIGY